MTEYRVFVLLVFVAVLCAGLLLSEVISARLLCYLDRKWREASDER